MLLNRFPTLLDHPCVARFFFFGPEKQSDTAGQILTLRRDSSMADRRALSLSFFKKPCRETPKKRWTDTERERERMTEKREKQGEILAGLDKMRLEIKKRKEKRMQSSKGTDLTGAPSFALREIEAAAQFFHPNFSAPLSCALSCAAKISETYAGTSYRRTEKRSVRTLTLS